MLKRTAVLMVRLTPEERALLVEAAAQAGLPTGAYIRSLAVAAARKAMRESK